MSYQQGGYQQGGYNQGGQQGGYQQQGPAQTGVDEGMISAVYRNERNGRTTFAIVLDGDDRRRYSSKYEPKFTQGNYVRIEYAQRGNAKFVNRLSAGNGQGQGQGGHQQQQQQQGGQQGGRVGSEGDQRTRSIVRQTLIKSIAPTILANGGDAQTIERLCMQLEPYALGEKPLQAAPQPQQGYAQPQGGQPHQGQGGAQQGAAQGQAPGGYDDAFDDDIPF